MGPSPSSMLAPCLLLLQQLDYLMQQEQDKFLWYTYNHHQVSGMKKSKLFASDEKQLARRKPRVKQACLECKRCKIKCEDARPCSRCITRGRCCLYPESRWTNYKQENTTEKKRDIKTPQTAQSGAPSTVEMKENTSINQSGIASPSSSSTPPPTSFFFSQHFTDLVREKVDLMRPPAFLLHGSTSSQQFRSSSSSPSFACDPLFQLLTTDPLWKFDIQDAEKLINELCDGDGMLYPALNRQKLLSAAQTVLLTFQYEEINFVELSKAILMEALSNHKTIQIRLVLAIALSLRGGDSAEKAHALAETVRGFVNTLVLSRNNVEDVQTLFLAALYQYHTDNASLASRIAAVAARSCLELGLHRSCSSMKSSCLFDEECGDLRVFWSIYMLERKASLCQGMPFIIQDIYIDPSLFAHLAHHPCSPDSPSHPMALSESELMLSALLEGAKLSGMAWHSIQSFDQTGSAPSLDKLDHLDYQIVQWYERLPFCLRFSMPWLRLDDLLETPTFIQAVLFFQRDLLRNLIYKPILQLPQLFAQNRSRVQLVTKLARDSLQTLADLNDKTPLIRNFPIYFKEPLLSALTNLLSTVVNGGAASWSTARHEIGIGLTLLQLISTKSPCLMEIWNSIKWLEGLQTNVFDPMVDEFLAGNQSPSEDSSLGLLQFEEDYMLQPLE